VAKYWLELKPFSNAISVTDRTIVYQFAAVFGKGGDAHAAVGGHFFQVPRLPAARAVFREIAEKVQPTGGERCVQGSGRSVVRSAQ
jgi:hypothetical protein